ncbi:MAG: 50S ribosomal protein L17 [Chloroflexi bacterium]|nr:50S ribosomal protein L17 [Chloroflexota bacterium]
MRHRKSGRHLSRNMADRRALYRNQTTDFLRNGKMVTTEAKAKEVRRFAEKIITLGKGGSLHDRRQALSFLFDENVVTEVFATIAPKYKDRSGGYTRITRLGQRKGDSAPLVQLELV